MPPEFKHSRLASDALGPAEQRMAIAHEADVHGLVMFTYNLLHQRQVALSLATTVATVVSELAMNIVKYADSGGSVRIVLATKGRVSIEIWAQDNGPGIPDTAQAMQDHFSSTGTLGVGLPGVKRMVDEFDLQSALGVGTSVRVKKWLSPGVAAFTDLRRTARSPSVGADRLPHPVTDSRPHPDAYATVNRPCFGETVSGDRPLVRVLSTGVLIGMIDVLGHGPEAHALALHCERWLMAQTSGDVEALLYALHRDIKGSRGAAISLAWVTSAESPEKASQVTVVGVGNTLFYALQDKVTAISAQPGILGGNMPRLRPMILPVSVGDVLLLATDGMSERVDSSQLLSLKGWPVRRIANEVLRVYGKAHDDAACAVLRHGH